MGAASTVGSVVGSGVSAVGSKLSGVSEYLPDMSGLPSMSGLPGMSSLPSMSGLPSLPSMSSLPGMPWRGGALLNDKMNKLEYNKVYPLTNKTFDLTMFDTELNDITFLTKSERDEFNQSKMGKMINTLSIELDAILTTQLNYIVKQDTIRVSMYLVVMQNLVNFIMVNIPTYKKGLDKSLKTYNLVLKHDVKLIGVKSLFPELLSIDPISQIYPLHFNTLKHNKTMNPRHVSRYLNNTKKINKPL